MTSNTYQDDNLVACPPNVGPTGHAGGTARTAPTARTARRQGRQDGKDGANGKDGAVVAPGDRGATTITQQPLTASKLVGNTLRTLRVSVRNGAKFLGAKATLRNRRLPVRGRTIKVDLRDETVGNYNVLISTKYKKGGKSYTVRSVRGLSVSLAVR